MTDLQTSSQAPLQTPGSDPPPDERVPRPVERTGQGRDATGGRETGNRSTGEASPERPPERKPRRISIDALGPALGPFASGVAEELQVPPDWCAILGLASVAALVQSKARIRARAGWCEPLNLYAIGLGESGERKSACRDRFIEQLRPFEEESLEAARPLVARCLAARDEAERALREAKKEGAGLVEAHGQLASLEEPPNGRILAPNDVTPESLVEAIRASGGSLAWIEAEGDPLATGIRYQGQSGPNLGLLKCAWGGERYVMQRRRGGGELIEIERPLLTIGILAQRDAIHRWAGQTGVRGEGLLPRFVLVAPESRLGSRDIDPPTVTSDAEEAFRAALHRASDVPEGTVLELSPEARRVFDLWRGDIEERLRAEGDLRTESAWGSKITGNVLRIAGLLHVAETPDRRTIVDSEVVVRAIAIGQALATHWLAFAAELGASRSEAVREAVMEVLDARGEASLRDLERSHRSALSDRSEVRAALGDLKEDGVVEVVPGRPGGRPTKRWRRKSESDERSKSAKSSLGYTQAFGTNGTFVTYDLSSPAFEEPPFPTDADRPPWLDELEGEAL